MKRPSAKTFFFYFLPLLIAATLALFLRQYDAGERQNLSMEEQNEAHEHFYPSEWFWRQRLFPNDTADKDAYRLAMAQRRQMQTLQKKSAGGEWQFVGPDNIGGRIVDIEFNPQNSNIVYAAAATGGVFKSIDHGLSWKAIFDEMPVLTIGDIAVDPVNPDIIYVGTGEANGGHNNFPGGGVYKSLDGGGSWQFIGLEGTTSIGRILVNPQQHEQVVVAAVGSYFSPDTARGLYISDNGGETWRKSLFVSDSCGAVDVAMDAANPSYMMAAMWERVRRPVYSSETHLYGSGSGIYRSLDGGDSWQRLGAAQGLPDESETQVGRIGLTMSPQNGQIVYALYNDGSNISHLFKTTDGGDNWRDLHVEEDLSNGTGGFSWYFGQIRVHPQHADTLWTLDVALMRSVNGGMSWPLKLGYGNYANMHVDHHALAFDPSNTDYIVDGNDGGIFISQDCGINWKKVSGLPVSQFYEIGIDPQHSDRFYGGTQDNGTLRTLNGEASNWERIFGGDGFYVLVDPNNSQTIYAEYQFGELFKSTNGGASFSYIVNDQMKSEPHNWSTPIAMDPFDSNVLYYGTNSIWRSMNGGTSWTKISPNLTRQLENSRLGTITTIAVNPSFSEVIYVGTDDGLVWRSGDNGDSWQNITGSLPFRWVTRVVPDPYDPGVVYVTFSGLRWRDPQPHVFKSSDSGQHWSDISANLPDAPINAMAVDPENTSMLFVGNDVGAFVSFNGGQSWQILDQGMPAVVVNDLKIHPVSHELIAGTHGRSMYKLDISQLTGIKDKQVSQAPEQFILYGNYPNPFNPRTSIKYRVASAAQVNLTVFNALGQKVATLVSRRQPAGEYKVEWDASGFASGVYYCTLSTDQGFVQSRKLVLLK